MRYLNPPPVMGLAIISLASVLTFSGWGQQRHPGLGKQSDACSNIAEERFNIARQYRKIRTIEDPGTHKHWILLRNLSCPGTPALLIQSLENVSCEGSRGKKSGACFALDDQSFLPPVIHAGDSLIVSEHTSVLDADLEATALTAAAVGDRVTVRLKLGGRTLSVIATGSGRTVWEDCAEVRR